MLSLKNKISSFHQSIKLIINSIFVEIYIHFMMMMLNSTNLKVILNLRIYDEDVKCIAEKHTFYELAKVLKESSIKCKCHL
jgi:hypothetical protein